MENETIPFNPDGYDIYCIIVPFSAERNEEFLFLTESVWRDSREGDLWYRIDSARPEMSILRHVHIAHKKQLSSPNTQVSWNDNRTRHDIHNFNTSFSPMEKAKALAKEVLRLPDEAFLEAATLTEIYGSYMLTEAASTAGVPYTSNNLFILRIP